MCEFRETTQNQSFSQIASKQRIGDGAALVESLGLSIERASRGVSSASRFARADAERAEGALDRLGPCITPQALKTFARQARKSMRIEGGGYRRDHLRALAQRIEVDAKEVRIMGSKSELLRTLVAASSAKTAGFGVPSFVPKWRARRDSNSRPSESKSDALSS